MCRCPRPDPRPQALSEALMPSLQRIKAKVLDVLRLGEDLLLEAALWCKLSRTFGFGFRSSLIVISPFSACLPGPRYCCVHRFVLFHSIIITPLDAKFSSFRELRIER